MNLKRLDQEDNYDHHQRQKLEYKEKRRRSGKVPHPKNTAYETEEETEKLKEEYVKLKQQLIELQKLKPKRNEGKVKTNGQNTQRKTSRHHNRRPGMNDKESNHKFVRFHVNEKEKRGKTPNHKKDRSDNFYFEDDDSYDEDQAHFHTRNINDTHQPVRRIESQYNKSKHMNSMLICKINKVENLKIVHTSDQNQDFKTSKTKPSSRRGSAGFDASDKNYTRSKNNTYIDNSEAGFPETSHRNNHADLQEPKSATNLKRHRSKGKGTFHTHHKSSNDISSPQSSDLANNYDTQFVEMTKKKHRKDMKSGDLKGNNFKYMNVNWLNQPNESVMPSFYANQPPGQNLNASNLMMFQQMNMGMVNNIQNQDELSMFLNQNGINQSQLNNNQSLLLFDKQSNSVIPVNSTMLSKMGLMQSPKMTPASNTKNNM